MKTRAQIYEREAAALLRDISMYHVMTEKQLLLLHPGKRTRPETCWLTLSARTGSGRWTIFTAPPRTAWRIWTGGCWPLSGC